MAVIELTMVVNAPVERCFDLSRSIDLHKLSTEGTNEEAVAGVTTGLLGMNEQVTWRAKHFGITQRLTSKITAFEYPTFFRDEMVSGALKKIRHDHFFYSVDGATVMRERFEFASPGGFLGRLFDHLVLEKYFTKFLVKRNEVIRQTAEGDQWRMIINQ